MFCSDGGGLLWTPVDVSSLPSKGTNVLPCESNTGRFFSRGVGCALPLNMGCSLELADKCNSAKWPCDGPECSL